MNKLVDAVNAAFLKAYPEDDLVKPSQDEAVLCKRVEMLVDDLLCTRVNFHVTNRAYVDAYDRLRGLKKWWEFWK